jgi:hypothetical protein
MLAAARLARALSARSLFTSSRVSLKDFVSKVPGMGDSITEGSLIKLVKPIGSMVAQDEIVAVIETDKVRLRSSIFFPPCARDPTSRRCSLPLFPAR